MERCKTLINKLQEQLAANANPSAMIITVQMLHAELARLASEQPAPTGSAGVSVVFPGYRKSFESVPPAMTGPAAEHIPAPVAEALPAAETIPVAESISLQAVAGEDLKRIPAEKVESLPEGIIFPVADQPGNRDIWVLDPILTTPTLAHQDEIKELNEKIGNLGGESLNDRLKTSRTEISSFLTDTPVRELKKAIGINDRFLFINELFRGDVDMYERSIKTINNFRILPEAEYWIERELKIKLGWDNATEAAMLFYQLVKRRFS